MGRLAGIVLLFWIPLLTLGLLSSWWMEGAHAQSVEINVTVKEEQLPDTQLADLMKEPEFLKTIRASSSSSSSSNAGKDSSSSSSPSTTQTPHLQFKVLSSGNPNSHFFHVDKSSGVIYIKEKIDRETVCSFRTECQLQFELAATSAYNIFFVLIDFRVTILDINDNPPEFVQPEFDLFIPENAESGRSFQLPTAFDRDTGPGNGVKSYTLLEGAPSFQLDTVLTEQNTSDIYIRLASTVNRESAAFYKLVVGATDGGKPPLTGLLTVNVKVSDINDNFPVFDKPVYVIEVPEDRRTDHSIVQVKASDADAGANGELVYSFSPLQPPDNLAFFRIQPASGKVFLTKSIESRTGQDLELIVQARDKGHPPKVSTCTIKIHVKDTVNSMPQIIVDPLAGGSEIAEVSEYANMGKVMFHVSVRDPDSGDNGRVDCRLDTPEFKLLKLTDDGKFKVELMTSLDREVTDFYNVTIYCSDHGFFSLLATAKFFVRVLDENDHWPVFSQRVYETSIYENNTIGASVIQLTVTDKDIGKNAEIDFSVLGINYNLFDIDKTGKMTAKVPLNREESDRIVVKVKATDRGNPPLSSSATVVVDLIDINDMRPVFNQDVYQFEVDEEQSIGRYIGIVSASDGDLGENKRIFYKISPPVPEFVVGAEGGVLKTDAMLDREVQKIYEFQVEATDFGTPSLTGTCRVIIVVKDVNDNTPYFVSPYSGNDSMSIPHTFDLETTIIKARALDSDIGLNAKITYSISSINNSSPFAIDPDNGNVHLEASMAPSDTGLYFLTLIASDSNPDSQLSTQIPFYIDVFFDNSTLLASMDTAGPSQTIIVILAVIGVCVLLGAIIFFTFVCIRRSEVKKRGQFPLSASTLSTTKLQGGYYISPGVRASSSTFLNKPDAGLVNGHLDTSDGGGSTSPMHVGNPYTVMMPHSPGTQPEIVEISRGANRNPRLDDTFNTLDLDQTDDGQFSTFKSQENIIAPLPRHDSLRRQSTGTSVYKSGNDTFDDLSCDSTSDSGRGGSDVDVTNGAAALKEKARAKASTPISVKSGISDRLSPLPRDQRGAFLTFRGESPSSFKFDSDSDTTLTRHSLRSRFPPPNLPMISSPDPNAGNRNSSSVRSQLHSESDTDTDTTPRSRLNTQPSALAGMYSGGVAGGYNSGGEGTSRQPFRVAALPTFIPPFGTQLRYDDDLNHSDGGGSNASSIRRNHIPRLPVYSGVDFTHHAYGGSNRNSIGAFSNLSTTSNSDSCHTDNERALSQPYSNNINNNNNNNNHNTNSHGDNNHCNNPNPHRTSYLSQLPRPPSFLQSNNRNSVSGLPEPMDSVFSSRYNNVVSELQTSRPVSMEEELLLPPYPEMDEEDESNRTPVPSRYGRVNSVVSDGERDALVL